MTRPGRPRKNRDRKKCGRLKKIKGDPRWETAAPRMRDFGVTADQATSPFAGYLAGVLFLRRRLSAQHMGHFYSFLQVVPVEGRSIPIREKVQGGSVVFSQPLTQGWYNLMMYLSREEMDVLHSLARDQLTVSVKKLKHLLELVPMTRGGYAFAKACGRERAAMKPDHPFGHEREQKVKVYFLGKYIGAYRDMRAAVDAYDRRAHRHNLPG